jgi:valyl-tRNA synthetase
MIKLNEQNIKSSDDLPYFNNQFEDLSNEDKLIVFKFNKLRKFTSDGIENYRFGIVLEKIYDFTWHEFADKYIESAKIRLDRGDKTPLIVLRHVLLGCLKLLHPFTPFITEVIWRGFKDYRKFPEKMLIESEWPKTER